MVWKNFLTLVSVLMTILLQGRKSIQEETMPFSWKSTRLRSSHLKKKTEVNKTAYITEYTAHVYRITVFLFYKRQRETTTPI